MKKNIVAFQSKSSLVVLILVLIIYSVLILITHTYSRLTADSMLYISIAQKYISGDMSNAINGYWGPLLSWFLIPFLFIGMSDVFALNALNLFFGILTIIGTWLLSYRFDISEKIRSIILLALLPIVFRMSVVQPMDFLLVCILVYYLNIVFRINYSDSSHHGIKCGILGSLAYVTKAYAFPFFIAHFFFINLFHYFRTSAIEDSKKVIRNALTGFLIFFLLSGIWIFALSNKYGHFTFSTKGKGNFSAIAPGASSGGGLEFGVPVFHKGFYEPPNETAFVVWEDPSFLKGEKWSPLDSFDNFKYFLKLVVKNIAEGIHIFESLSALSIAIVIVYILFYSALPWNKLLSRTDLLYPLFTIFLYTGGYLLFHLELRYLWIINVLLLLMGGHILHVLFQTNLFKNKATRIILVFFFVITFIFTPSRHVLQEGKGNIDMDMYLMSTDLSKYNIQGDIASNREYIPVNDAWHKTFRLAYLLNCRYYGQPRANITDKELADELRKYNIDYYFHWGDSKKPPQFLEMKRELTNGEIPGLKIFSLREKNSN